MPQTTTPSAAVELAVVERSGFVESRHVGSAVVLAPDGTTRAELGSPSDLVLARSALKPVQALACLTSGAVLDDAQTGLATASHTGTERHVAVVRGILYGVGLGEDHLDCPASWPGDRAARDELICDLAAAAPVRSACSGKHAAMLATCVANDWETASYLDVAHPLQVRIRELVERLTGERVPLTAVDGCGAPAFATTLTGLARATHRIGTSAETSPFALHRHAGRLVRVVRENPWTIEGEGRADTLVAARLGAFAKSGAEGVVVIVAPDGTTVAVKVLDGGARATTAIALRLLERHGALDPAAVADTLSALPLTVTGHGRAVGSIRPTV